MYMILIEHICWFAIIQKIVPFNITSNLAISCSNLTLNFICYNHKWCQLLLLFIPTLPSIYIVNLIFHIYLVSGAPQYLIGTFLQMVSLIISMNSSWMHQTFQIFWTSIGFHHLGTHAKRKITSGNLFLLLVDH